MCRRTEEKNGSSVGLPTPLWHRHFVGFFNDKHRHGASHFTVIPRNRPILIAFYDTHGVTEDTFSTKDRDVIFDM